MNKQSRTMTRGGPPTWKLDEVLRTPHRKKLITLQSIQRSFGIKLILRYDLKLDGGGGDGIDWIDLAEDRDRWRAVVNTVTNLRVP
jgi:hypothetical protein